MALYAIILESPSNDAWENIRSSWPEDHHIFDDRLAFINGDNLLTKDVSKKIGIGPQISGVVIQMGFFAGHIASNLVMGFKASVSNQDEGNVVDFQTRQALEEKGCGGNGGDIRERLSKLEKRVDAIKEHMAEKNDITSLKAWILGGMLSAIVVAATIATITVKALF